MNSTVYFASGMNNWIVKRIRLQCEHKQHQVDIDLDRFTVFVGKNGSGKTSILHAIQDASNRNSDVWAEFISGTKDSGLESECNLMMLMNAFSPGRCDEIKEMAKEVIPGLVNAYVVKGQPILMLDFGTSKQTVMLGKDSICSAWLWLMSFFTKILGMGYGISKLFLVDNLGSGLHPTTQRLLMKTLNKFLERHPDIQIIATTHCFDILNHLEHHQVRVLAIDEQGNTHCKKLSDHKKFSKWYEEFYPGEFWSMMGEDWVFQDEIPPQEKLGNIPESH